MLFVNNSYDSNRKRFHISVRWSVNSCWWKYVEFFPNLWTTCQTISVMGSLIVPNTYLFFTLKKFSSNNHFSPILKYQYFWFNESFVLFPINLILLTKAERSWEIKLKCCIQKFPHYDAIYFFIVPSNLFHLQCVAAMLEQEKMHSFRKIEKSLKKLK